MFLKTRWFIEIWIWHKSKNASEFAYSVILAGKLLNIRRTDFNNEFLITLTRENFEASFLMCKYKTDGPVVLMNNSRKSVQNTGVFGGFVCVVN